MMVSWASKSLEHSVQESIGGIGLSGATLKVCEGLAWTSKVVSGKGNIRSIALCDSFKDMVYYKHMNQKE